MKAERIPPATVARLPIYVQGLSSLAGEGLQVVSSERLAATIGVQAPQIRRDLSYLGAFGTPGVGYGVKALLLEVSRCLGLSREWPVAIVGCGKLGSALAGYPGFLERNFRIVAAFDTNPLILGIRVGEVAVMPLDRLPQVVQRLGIEIAILSTPAAAAQEAADRLVAAGISSILNFTPTVLSVPPEVTIRNIDLAAEMQILSFHQTLKQAGAPVSLVHAVARCPMPSRRSRGRA